MTKTILILIIVFTCAGIILTAVSIRVFSNPVSQIAVTPSPSPQNQLPNQLPTYPINPKGLNVIGAQVNYQLAATLQRVTESPKGLEIVTDIPHAPNFLIQKNTRIVTRTNGKEASASASALKPNQKINIYTIYKSKANSWITNKIAIIYNSSASATPR